jgi:hypothetical protein
MHRTSASVLEGDQASWGIMDSTFTYQTSDAAREEVEMSDILRHNQVENVPADQQKRLAENRAVRSSSSPPIYPLYYVWK